VGEFEPIITGLWDGFREINEIKTRNALFAGLAEHFARAFGDVLLFIAEATTVGEKSPTFGILAWCCPEGKRGDYPHVAAVPAWGKHFRSKILEKTLDPATSAVFFGPKKFKSEERGPLRNALPNLAATRVWFYGQNTLCIGISKLIPSQDPDLWVGADAQVLRYFPELLATPLRMENEYLETELFRKTCRAGIPAEVVRRGEQILRPRVEMAWRVRMMSAQHATRVPPRISGDYDFLFAQYLDASRYVVALDSPDAAEPDHGAEVERFARVFSPSGRPGNSQLLLYASGDARSENSFLLSRTALLSRHAVARALFWLAYKTGALSGGDAGKPRCSLAGDVHPGCKGDWQCLDVMREFVEVKSPPSGKVLGPHSVHASWLRCLWLEIYYRARRIREHRGDKSEELLAEVAQLYTRAVKATRKAFQSALVGLHDTEGHVRIDWRWLYIWMLGNAMLSNALAKQYGTYKQGQHGYLAHLDHYRDASTTVLFGLHLLRFWDSPSVPELWDLPEIRPDEVTQARLRLLCEYAYMEIGVDRTWQLEHHLGAQFQPELVLQAASPAHREHAFHVMDVCLLGHLLLQSQNGKGGPSRLAKAVLGTNNSAAGNRALLRRWYPAALLHDVGYALALARRLPDLLQQFSTPDLASYSKAVNQGIQDAHVKFDESVHRQFKEAGLVLAGPPAGVSRDHGVVSANHLIHSLTKAAGDERLLKVAHTKEVLQAIARHNRSEEVFSAAEDPLSFFLVLCDHMQDWDRTRVRSRRLAMSFLASTQMSVPFSVKGQGAAQYLVPNARYVPATHGLVFRAESPRLELHYSVPQSALLEPACIWVDTCADFERIWFSRRFPEIILAFVHPRSEVLIRAGYDSLEMELLRDFARTQDGAFLTAWLKALDEGKTDGLSYGADHSAKTERFAVRLGSRRKATLRLLSGASGGFYSKFVEWKERQLRVGPDEE
jgi:hypothetical protein